MIGERTAEDVKISIGSTFKDDQEQNMQIRGFHKASPFMVSEVISILWTILEELSVDMPIGIQLSADIYPPFFHILFMPENILLILWV